MRNFNEKSENFKLFEDLFQTSLRIHNQLTEENNFSYFHFLMRGVALQTFENTFCLNREVLEEIPTVFCRK